MFSIFSAELREMPFMLDQFHRQILPVPPPAVELFENYQVTRAFYEEMQLRQAFKQHCQWYQQVAEQHRRELVQMRRDVNILGWFYHTRRSP